MIRLANKNDIDRITEIYEAADEEVMVLHTLVVDPAESGKGCGKEFVNFYEAYAREKGCGQEVTYV